jgi:hypothetical protein
MTKETVNHPDHYGGDVIYETIKVLEATMTSEQFVGFLRGNAIKYAMRAGKKVNAEEDLAKASWYINYEIDFCRRYQLGNIGEDRAARLGYNRCTKKGSELIKQMRMEDGEFEE